MTVQNRIGFIKKLQDKSKQPFVEAKTLYKENLYDGSISRAYYSMFYLARAVLATKDISRRKHSAVHSVFGERFAKPGFVPKMLHLKLLRAFEARQGADYEVEISKTESDAKDILDDAREFNEKITKFLERWVQETESN